MKVLVCGSTKGYGDVKYDIDTFKMVASKVEKLLLTCRDITFLFAGSPYSDCLSLELASRMNSQVEKHLPPWEKVREEYNSLSVDEIGYFLLLLDKYAGSNVQGYYNHRERNDAIASLADIVIAVTTMPHSLFLHPSEDAKKSGTLYIWNTTKAKQKYHYSLVDKTFLQLFDT